MKKVAAALIIFSILLPGIVLAQVHNGDTEISLLGTFSNYSGDKEHFSMYSQTIIAMSLGIGKFISPNIQVGIQPTWNYLSYKYTEATYDYENWEFSEEEKTESDGVFGMNIFSNFNFTPESNLVPYVTAQFQIGDFSPEGGNMMDASALGLGGGIRYFPVQHAAINTVLTYNFPLKDAEYKYKSLVVIFGLSLFL